MIGKEGKRKQKGVRNVSEFKINNGAKVKDSVTGFAGTVTGRADYLTGCRQYLVQPRQTEGKDEYPDPHWFDEDRLVKGKDLVAGDKPENNGGPQACSAPVK
jgi:hypothetical protein